VTVLREDRPGLKRLVTYVIARPEQPPTVSELRRFLEQKLPDYMLPSAFVLLDRFPLTPHGKIDRRALPLPDLIRPELEQTFVAPRTAVEEVMALIWAEVLGVEQVGVDDNFFDLGGDSILSIRVQSMARERDLCFTLQQLFQHPTIRELTRAVRI